MSWSSRSLARLGVITALLTAAATLSAQNALAAGSSPPPSGPIQALASRMNLVCIASTPSAIQYAERYGTCPPPPGGTVASTTIQPDSGDTVYGNCGWSSLNFTNQANGGWMTVWEKAYSYDGPITYVNWSVNWTNWDRDSGGNVNGAMFTFNAFWYHDQAAWTNTGYVSGYMNGWVVTALGAVCTFLTPSGWTTVT